MLVHCVDKKALVDMLMVELVSKKVPKIPPQDLFSFKGGLVGYKI